uniref:N-acetyltransferase domain-containing protein n=1 Tax=Arcella intermedia TaxID=1963864 RepID=A0A6B2LK65_9EUKA
MDYYKSEEQLPAIMKLMETDLSEPYSIYTYRYFINNWPKLCWMAFDGDKTIGAIVCKLDIHKSRTELKTTYRGYIAMLAVNKEYRGKGLGSELVIKAISVMREHGCTEVILETEITNKGALSLYYKLGFLKDKRLYKYYLNGVDAFRLKLELGFPTETLNIPEKISEAPTETNEPQ